MPQTHDNNDLAWHIFLSALQINNTQVMHIAMQIMAVQIVYSTPQVGE